MTHSTISRAALRRVASPSTGAWRAKPTWLWWLGPAAASVASPRSSTHRGINGWSECVGGEV